VSQDEKSGEQTSVVLVHADGWLSGCSIFEDLADYLEKMKCKVDKVCLSGHCSSESSQLFKSNPSDVNVLLVFLLTNHEWYVLHRLWLDSAVSVKYLLQIQPYLRRVILSPHPGYNAGLFSSLIRDDLEIFNDELEKWCAENVMNFRILHPDSLPKNEYDWIETPKFVREKLAQMILDLATNPEAKYESYVESSNPYKVSTNTLTITMHHSPFIGCQRHTHCYMAFT
jgi:hypothetical protein